MPLSWARTAQWRTELGAVLVDARSAREYAAGHVPGAISLPRDSAPEQYAAFAQRFGPDRPVVVYGGHRGDVNAFLTARKLLREYGFQATRFTNEGYQEWLAKQDEQARQP
jgi:rhodanese-related sulfurtransferase